jgi:ribosomal protein S21
MTLANADREGFRPMTVKVVDGDIHAALGKFRFQVQAEGIVREIRRRSHFVPRSTARKVKSLRARRRRRR